MLAEFRGGIDVFAFWRFADFRVIVLLRAAPQNHERAFRALPREPHALGDRFGPQIAGLLGRRHHGQFDRRRPSRVASVRSDHLYRDQHLLADPFSGRDVILGDAVGDGGSADGLGAFGPGFDFRRAGGLRSDAQIEPQALFDDDTFRSESRQGDVHDEGRAALDRGQVFAASGDVHQGWERFPNIPAAPQEQERSRYQNQRPRTRLTDHGFRVIDSGWLQYGWLPAPVTQMVSVVAPACRFAGTATFTCSSPSSPGAAPAYWGARLP